MLKARLLFLMFLAAALFATFGCGGNAGSSSSSASSSSSQDPPEAVFIGSSQTSQWPLSTSFPKKNYVNKGVSGNLSADVLARFQTDVVALKPRVVLIWAGDNDIQKGVPLADVETNITSMYQQGVAAGIRVILCTLAPQAGAQAGQNPLIVQFNDWLRSFASTHPSVLADYYPVLVDSNGELRSDYTVNGQHLNAAGYAAVTPVAAAAIASAEQ